MPNETARQIRMPDSLWKTIGAIAKELDMDNERGAHSAIIREILSAAADKWNLSPYVCRSAHHVILVTKQGNVFYRQVQLLKLNSEREKLPCVLEMKPEKRIYYSNSRPENAITGDWFRSRWLLNYFAVWKGNLINAAPSLWGEPLAHSVDRTGARTKMADLPVHEDPGRFLTREFVVGLRDYVQWMEEGQPKYDRVDLPIDIPTRDLSVTVVVDEEIYQHKRVQASEITDLGVEFRNRESAKFLGKEIALSQENRMTEIHGRSYASDDDDSRIAREQVNGLIDRVNQLKHQTVEGAPIIHDDVQMQEISESLTLPMRFLFCEIDWPSPHFGIELCVRWEKPIFGSNPREDRLNEKKW